MDRKKVAIACGGTGGHILPALKIAEELEQMFDIIYIGVGLERNPYFPQEGKTFFDVRGCGTKEGFLLCMQENLQGMKKAWQILKRERVDFLIGMGSFHSFSTLLAASLQHIPFYLFGLDLLPGRVTRLFAPVAEATLIHFAPTKNHLRGKSIEVNCLFERSPFMLSQQEAKAHFNLDSDKPTLLIFGGSQGSTKINELIKNSLSYLQDKFQILHFTGKDDPSCQEAYNQAGIKAVVLPFCHEMAYALCACDFSICRSGAGALRDMILYEKPALFIPYFHAKDDHQKKNAEFFIREVRGALMLEETQAKPEALISILDDLFFSPSQKLHHMRESIKAFKQKEGRPYFLDVIFDRMAP